MAPTGPILLIPPQWGADAVEPLPRSLVTITVKGVLVERVPPPVHELTMTPSPAAGRLTASPAPAVLFRLHGLLLASAALGGNRRADPGAQPSQCRSINAGRNRQRRERSKAPRRDSPHLHLACQRHGR